MNVLESVCDRCRDDLLAVRRIALFDQDNCARNARPT